MDEERLITAINQRISTYPRTGGRGTANTSAIINGQCNMQERSTIGGKPDIAIGNDTSVDGDNLLKQEVTGSEDVGKPPSSGTQESPRPPKATDTSCVPQTSSQIEIKTEVNEYLNAKAPIRFCLLIDDWDQAPASNESMSDQLACKRPISKGLWRLAGVEIVPDA